MKDIEDVVGFIPTGWSHNFGLKYQKKNDDDENEMSGNTEYCLELMKNDRDNDDENGFEISSILRQYKSTTNFKFLTYHILNTVVLTI